MICYPWEIEGPKCKEILTIIEKVLKKKFQRGTFFSVFIIILWFIIKIISIFSCICHSLTFSKLHSVFVFGRMQFVHASLKWHNFKSRKMYYLSYFWSFWTLVFNVFFPMFVWILWLGLEANNSVVRTNLLLK